MLNSGLALKEGLYDYITIIGSNPRFEASLFNVRLRQLVITKKNLAITVKSIGNPLNLTYPNEQQGTNIKTLYLTTQGKTNQTKNIIKADKPLTIIGINAIQRQDGAAIQPMVNYIYRQLTKVNTARDPQSEAETKAKNHRIAKKHKLHNVENGMRQNTQPESETNLTLSGDTYQKAKQRKDNGRAIGILHA